MEYVRNQGVLQEDEYNVVAAAKGRARKKGKRAYHRLSFLAESFGEGLLESGHDVLHRLDRD